MQIFLFLKINLYVYYSYCMPLWDKIYILCKFSVMKCKCTMRSKFARESEINSLNSKLWKIANWPTSIVNSNSMLFCLFVCLFVCLLTLLIDNNWTDWIEMLWKDFPISGEGFRLKISDPFSRFPKTGKAVNQQS